MTPRFPALRRALALFADLDWAVADRLLQRMTQEPGKATMMREELDIAAQDPSTNWADLVANDSYELTDGDDPEAKDLVLNFLWDALHPNDPPRNLDVATYRAYLHATSTSDSVALYDFEAGTQTDVRIEDVGDHQELARVSHMKRVGNVLHVTYEPVRAHPLPSTLRKLLRSTLRNLLVETSALSGVTGIEFEDKKSRGKELLAL